MDFNLPIPGFVQMLDPNHQPVGPRDACTFRWAIRPGGWAVELS
jgi:hypothetical protein